MANEEHLAILRQGVEVWNKWREENPNVRPDLYGIGFQKALLREANLVAADLRMADLTAAELSMANFRVADLSGAKLCEAKLGGTDFREANLNGTNLTDTFLINALFGDANLNNANLNGANLGRANFHRALLTGVNLANAHLGLTIFASNDLSNTKGLEQVIHNSPSTIGIDTLYYSKGKIPESFLRSCGVPDILLEYLPALIGATEPIQFYSCFISYSSKDENFARRLHSHMRDNHLRVWFAPEDMKGGQKLHEQIDQAIHVYDKLVLVLSEQSIQSEWVMTEIRKARKAELRDQRRKLFPIRLVDMDTLRDWECFDADTGKDLAVEVREYFIPDFTRWKHHDSFERAFERFLKDLQATEAPPVPEPVELPTTINQSRIVKPQNPQTVIARKKRRLEVLEEQQAIKGISTPPEVVTEIEDLRREIAEL